MAYDESHVKGFLLILHVVFEILEKQEILN